MFKLTSNIIGSTLIWCIYHHIITQMGVSAKHVKLTSRAPTWRWDAPPVGDPLSPRVDAMGNSPAVIAKNAKQPFGLPFGGAGVFARYVRVNVDGAPPGGVVRIRNMAVYG